MPEKIKYDNEILYYCERYSDYCNEEGDNSLLYTPLERLNNEIEIIEEEKKIPEKIDQHNFEWEYIYSKKSNEKIIHNLNILRLKYNEIIDYLKSKGDE